MGETAVVLQKIIDAAKAYNDTPDYELQIIELRPEPDEFFTLSLVKEKEFSYAIGGNYFTGCDTKTRGLTPEEAAQFFEGYHLHTLGAIKTGFKEAFSSHIAAACKKVIAKKLDDLMR